MAGELLLAKAVKAGSIIKRRKAVLTQIKKARQEAEAQVIPSSQINRQGTSRSNRKRAFDLN